MGVEMEDVVLTHYNSREDWLASRDNGVGASEAAALFGLSPWDSPLSLWSRKRGLVRDEDEAANEWLEIGLLTEPISAELYRRRTGRQLWAPSSSWAIAKHPTAPLFASIDRWVIDAEGKPGRGVLELKNVGFGRTDEWDDGPPLRVQIQIQSQLAVTGFQWGSAAAILGGNRFVWVDVERNDDFVAELEALAADFWAKVQSGAMPAADGSDATARALKRLFPRDDGTAVHLAGADVSAWNALALARKTKAAAEKEEKRLKNLLAKSIGAATFGLLPDGRLLSYRHRERGGYTVEPTTYRVLQEEEKPTSPDAFVDEVNKHVKENS